jgi:2,5-furandicarboxylate decarboxylase 1
VDVMVPATAEIVIEGYLKANEHETEGPFGEYTGYMTGRSTNNVMEVTAITMRRDAVFVDIVPGNSAEHLTLGRISKEAWIFTRMKEALPFFTDFHYPASGTHFHCYLRINKSGEGQAKQAAELLMGLDHYVKMVIVVDQDIDPTNEAEVLWAMATRMQADRDTCILSGLMCNQLDPSSSNSIGAKLIVDATRSPDDPSRRVDLVPEAQHHARELLERLGW